MRSILSELVGNNKNLTIEEFKEEVKKSNEGIYSKWEKLGFDPNVKSEDGHTLFTDGIDFGSEAIEKAEEHEMVFDFLVKSGYFVTQEELKSIISWGINYSTYALKAYNQLAQGLCRYDELENFSQQGDDEREIADRYSEVKYLEVQKIVEHIMLTATKNFIEFKSSSVQEEIQSVMGD